LAARDANITDENQIARLVMAEYARLLEPFKTGNNNNSSTNDGDTLKEGEAAVTGSAAQILEQINRQMAF